MTEKRWLRLPRPEGGWTEWMGPYEGYTAEGKFYVDLPNVLPRWKITWTLPVGQPDDTGWIPWGGGDCPVPEGTLVRIKVRKGDELTNSVWNWEHTGQPSWEHTGHPSDIMWYRIEEPVEAPSLTEILSEWWEDAAGHYEVVSICEVSGQDFLIGKLWRSRDWFTGRKHLTTEELAEELEG